MSHEQCQHDRVGQLNESDLKLIEDRLMRMLDQLDSRFQEFGDRLCGQMSDLGDRIESVTDGYHLRSPGSSGLSEMVHEWQRETSPWTCQKEWNDH